MNSNTPFSMDTRVGICSGTTLVVLANITPDELLETAILAAVGATVSFMVSWILKACRRWYKKQSRNG